MRLKLLRYFSIASAVAVVVVTATLVVVYGRYATDSLVTSVEQQNVILASFIANDLSARLPQHFKTDIHDAEDLATARHLQHIKDIDAILKDLLKSLPVSKVKAYRDDLTIYSTDHSQIGEIKSSPGFLIAYQEGIPVSKLTFRGEFNAFEGVISNRNLIETYVPVGTFETMTGESSRLIIEIYTDVTPLVAEIEQSKVKLIAGLIFLFAALYGVLVLIVRQADRIIDRQYEDLDGEITERRRIEEALVESEERLRGAIESLGEGFALYDADDRLVAFNKKYLETLPSAQDVQARGGTFEDIIRANVEQGLITEAIGREEEFIRERLEQHRNPGEPVIRHFSDGRWVMINEARTPDGGIATSFTDITEIKSTEERTREHRAELTNARRLSLFGEMAAAMAHELNQPLAVISSYAQGLSAKLNPSDATQKDLFVPVEEINRQAERASNIITSIRAMAGKQELHKTAVDVKASIQGALDIIEPAYEKQGIKINTELANDYPAIAAD